MIDGYSGTPAASHIPLRSLKRIMDKIFLDGDFTIQVRAIQTHLGKNVSEVIVANNTTSDETGIDQLRIYYHDGRFRHAIMDTPDGKSVNMATLRDVVSVLGDAS